jgi:hypothetical protein
MRMQFMRRAAFFGNLIVAVLSGAMLMSVALNAFAQIGEPAHGYAQRQYLAYGGQALFRFASLALKASCGDVLVAIDDDPHGAGNNSAVSAASRSEPQSGTFALTRHSSLIRSMFASVV